MRTESGFSQKFHDYIKSQIVLVNPQSGTRLQETESKMEFDKISRVQYDEKYDALIIPIHDIDVTDFTKLDRSIKTGIVKVNGTAQNNTQDAAITKVMVLLDKSDNIVNANIIQLSSKSETQETLESSFVQIAGAKKKDFTGTVSVNSLSQKLVNRFGISNGKTISSTVVKPGSRSNAGVSVNTCLAWYLCTTYYYSDGSTDNDEIFLGTTGCGGSTNQGFEPPSDQGGGSDDTPPTPPDTLCAQSKRLSQDAAFATMAQALYANINNTSETVFALSASGGGYTSSEIAATNINSAILAFWHNHITGSPGLDANVFSLYDIQFMYEGLYRKGLITDLSNFTLGVMLPNGKIQILRVSDPVTYSLWAYQNLQSGSIFNNFMNTVPLSPTNTYDNNVSILLGALLGSGMDLYEGDVNNLSQGFSKVELSNSVILSTTIVRKKCTN